MRVDQMSNLLQEMRMMKMDTVESTKSAIGIEPKAIKSAESTHEDFKNMFNRALDNVNSAQLHSAKLKNAVLAGDPSVSLVESMVAGQKAGIAFEATVQVRNKLVEAYQTIMKMPL
jgi:flagellar hook-basal body complex protein FliE